MKPHRVNYASAQTLPRAEAEEYNRKLAAHVAHHCETFEDVEEMAIELAGHLSEIRLCQFREMLIDAWWAHNINKICGEVSAAGGAWRFGDA